MSQPSDPILVIEDDPDLAVMLATALQLDGRRVITAPNGREALVLAERHHPSLIVLDLMLPVMSGEEFRRAQLASDAIRAIPVLVVSARHDAALVAARLKAAGCLIKPVELETFTALVKTFAPFETKDGQDR